MKSLTLLSLLIATLVTGSVLTSCHYYDGPRRGGYYGREERFDDREERRDDFEEARDDRWEGRRGWRDYD